MSYLLGIDLGTSSLKTIVLAPDGTFPEAVAICNEYYALFTETFPAYQDQLRRLTNLGRRSLN